MGVLSEDEKNVNRWLDFLVGGGTPFVGCVFVFVDVSVEMRFGYSTTGNKTVDAYTDWILRSTT
jgi:hypothetical protein